MPSWCAFVPQLAARSVGPNEDEEPEVQSADYERMAANWLAVARVARSTGSGRPANVVTLASIAGVPALSGLLALIAGVLPEPAVPAHRDLHRPFPGASALANIVAVLPGRAACTQPLPPSEASEKQD